ncbi:glycosyltransferase family 9 protein [Sneathiella limimaris]|uniref:glycosyltransferase family 9 protein n=1 Tax=Sneathiella limimaris TaxID=1964213 RepID=UPI00146B0934|nr:glycosyltransferase family 9 protein [Sneathiella limimaris]
MRQKKILFVTSNRLGDAVLTTGVLEHLISEEPDALVTIVCGHIPAEIFRSNPKVHLVVAIKKRKYSLHWWDAFKAIDGIYWDRIVDFRGSPLGFLPCRKRHIWSSPPDDEAKTLSNAKMIGLQQPIPPLIRTNGFHLRSDLTQALSDDPVLAIGPTANHPLKQWDADNYANLARSLTSETGILPGAKIMIFGAPGEEEQAEKVIGQLPAKQVLNFVGKTNPMEAAALISKAKLFIGNDSGLMHTALAVKVPTVALFGIGKPKVYGPIGPNSLCLVGSPAGEDITTKTVTDPNGQIKRIERLPLEVVLEQVQTFYQSLKE